MEVAGFQHTEELQGLMANGHEIANYLDSPAVEGKQTDIGVERGITHFETGEYTESNFRWYFIFCEGGTIVSLNFRYNRISNATISEGQGGKDAVAPDVEKLLGK